jgi:hypothetical protein
MTWGVDHGNRPSASISRLHVSLNSVSGLETPSFMMRHCKSSSRTRYQGTSARRSLDGAVGNATKLPGGSDARWKTVPLHGALNLRRPNSRRSSCETVRKVMQQTFCLRRRSQRTLLNSPKCRTIGSPTPKKWAISSEEHPG